MSVNTVVGSRRRILSLVTAFTLALVGISTLQAPAEAVVTPTISVTPSPLTPGTVQNVTFTIAGGSAFNIAAIDITAPTGLSAISFVSLSGQAGWSYALVGSTLRLTADGPQNNKLQDGDSLALTVQAAVANTTGSTTVNAVSWPNKNRSGGTNALGGGTVVIGSVAQTITFAPLADKTFGDVPFTVAATGGGSGNPVTFSATGACTSTGTNGTTITLTGAGSCTVTANQAAGSGYTAAAPVARSFTIAKAAQTITLAPIGTQTFGGADVTVLASASSGLAVTLAASGDCTLTGTTLSLDGAGECTVTANQAGNADFNAAAEQSVTFTINKASAVLTLDGLGPFEYDGSSHAASASTVPDGLTGIALTYDGSSTPPTDAGSYTVVATLTNDDYQAESVTGTLVISPKALTGAFTVADKTYDGTTDATITGCTLPTGVVDGDDVSLDCSAATATFDSADAGLRTATLSGAVLTGADAGNYALDGTGTASATIAALQVTGAIQASDKTYDGTATATAVGQTLAGKIGSDDVSVDVVSASFPDKNVGTDRVVTATIQLLGADAGNYVLSSTSATDTATIFAKEVTATLTADDRVYDGTTDADATATLTGVLPDDEPEVAAQVESASFADKNVGVDKPVTATVSLAGAEAGNYQLASTLLTDTATISARGVTASFTAADKVWDGTTAATILTRTVNGKIAGDDLGLSGGTATFDTAAVGAGKTVTGTGFTLTGADAGNYVLGAGPWTTTASISALYRGTGFYQPVDMTPVGGTRVYNTIKGGQTVPLKFDIYNTVTGAEQTSLSIFGPDTAAQAAAFKINKIACTTTSAPDDAIEIVTTGATTLRYDGTAPAGQWIQNWKTPTTVGTCYSVSVVTVDGSSVGPAYFKITK